MPSRKIERVIILTNTLKSGGAEKQSVLLTKTLSDSYDTTLVVYYGDQIDEKLITLLGKERFKVLYLEGGHASKLYLLFKLFRFNKHTAVFSYLATTNLINAVLGKMSRIRLLVGGIRTDAITGFKFHLQKFLHNHLLHRTIFNNVQGQKKFCTDGFNPQKALTIHNCIEIRELQMQEKKDTDSVMMVSVGRFVEQKDYFTALKAFEIAYSKLLKEMPHLQFRYTIIGYGPLEEQIRKYIKDHRLSGLVSVILDPPNPREYLLTADIYLSSSVSEGLSNAIMEALEVGLPIIATDVGDTSQLVVNENNGYLVEVSNEQMIAEKLELLALDFTKRQEMGANSHRLLCERFSVTVFKEKYLQLIREFDAR